MLVFSIRQQTTSDRNYWMHLSSQIAFDTLELIIAATCYQQVQRGPRAEPWGSPESVKGSPGSLLPRLPVDVHHAGSKGEISIKRVMRQIQPLQMQLNEQNKDSITIYLDRASVK